MLGACAQEQPSGPVILAAASMQEALTEASSVWAAQGNPRPKLSFAASSALARQIESGAPADIYISADQRWITYLQQKQLTRVGGMTTIAGNRLLLIAPTQAKLELTALAPKALASALGNERFALAEPESVPAGRYGKEAFQKLELWPVIADQLTRSENVRAALSMVERGAAPLGLVYRSDAQASGKVAVVAEIAPNLHSPVRYQSAILKNARHPQADSFSTYLASEEALAIFRKYGFTLPE